MNLVISDFERPIGTRCPSSTFSSVILEYRYLFEQFSKRKYGSSLTQFWILCTLASEGELSISNISQILEVKYTTIADAARNLNGTSKLERIPRESDKREVMLAVTRAGVRYRNRIDVGLCGLTKKILSSLDPKEVEAILHAFYPYLNRIGKVITFNDLIRGDSIFVVMLCEMTRILTEAFQKRGLNKTHTRILILLGDAETAIRPKSIAETLGINACNISRALQQLEAEGYSQRSIGATAREKSVDLTPKGREIAQILASDIKAEMAARLLIDDDASFCSAIDKLAGSMADIRKYALAS